MFAIEVSISAMSEPFFFFQAEDGIRDYKVTGVQTCALPISRRRPRLSRPPPSKNAFASLTKLSNSFLDRKSTRLNSSHLVISYAVFCLKKKKKNNYIHIEPKTSIVHLNTDHVNCRTSHVRLY